MLAGVSSGKVIVDCATLTPERMIQEANQVKQRGGHFLEAPVSGSKGPAEQGQLIFLCGGGLPIAGLVPSAEERRAGADDCQYILVKEALDAMGKASFFFGPVGQVETYL